MNYAKLLINMKNKRNINEKIVDEFISIFKTKHENLLDAYIKTLSEYDKMMINELYINHITQYDLAEKLNVTISTLRNHINRFMIKLFKYIEQEVYCYNNELTPIIRLDLSIKIFVKLYKTCNSVEDIVKRLNEDKLKYLGLDNKNTVIKAILLYNETKQNNKLILKNINKTTNILEKNLEALESKKINEFDFFSRLSNINNLNLNFDQIIKLEDKIKQILKELNTNNTVTFDYDKVENNKQLIFKITLKIPSKIRLIKIEEINKIKIFKI